MNKQPWTIHPYRVRTNKVLTGGSHLNRLRGWARIGVLVSRLRGMVDNIIAMKVNNPQMDVRNNEVIRMVAKLVELDGLDA